MRKLLLMMLLAVSSVSVWGQIGTYGTDPNTTTISADGSTLKIKGKGNLATISQDVETKKFNASAVGKVFTSSDGGSTVVSIAENDIFSNAANTYYKEILGEKTRVDVDGESNDVAIYTLETYVGASTVRNVSKYIDGKLQTKELYYIYGTNNSWTIGDRTGTYTNGDPTKVTSSSDFIAYSSVIYLVEDSENGTIRQYITGTDDGDKFFRQITEEEFNDYVMPITYFKLNQSLYMSNDGTNFAKQEANVEITYDPAVHFYSVAASTYEPYDSYLEGETSVSNLFTAKDYLTSETTPMTFAEILANAVAGGSYTNVVFEKDGGEMIIDPAISQAVLYQNLTGNNTVKSLNLGDVTMTTIANAFAGKNGTGEYYLNNTCLEELVLPSKVNTEFTKVSYSNLINLKVVDISKAGLNNTQASTFDTGNYGNNRVAVIDADNMTEAELKARYTSTSKVSAVYSKSTSADPTQINIYIGDNINNVDFAAQASGYANVVLCSNAANVTSDLLTKVSACSGIKNLILAKMNGISETPFEEFTDAIVQRVILPDNTDVTTLSKKTTDCPIYQSYNTTSKKETILMTDAGDLGAISEYHYYSTDIDNAYWIEVVGNINADDVVFLNGINNNRLNLSLATNAVGDEEALRNALHDFENDNVEYLTWPVFTTEPSKPLYEDVREKCDKLIAVGQYVVPTSGHTKLIAYSKEEGKIKEITDMLQAATGGNVNIQEAKISGNLKAADIFTSSNRGVEKIGKDGHLYLSPGVDEYATLSQTRTSVADPSGETTTEGAFTGSNGVYKLDLSDAVFLRSEDLTLSKLNILRSETDEVKIPTSDLVTELPADFLNLACPIDHICIPSNIEKIHARAFYGLHLHHVWTTGDDPDVQYDHGCNDIDCPTTDNSQNGSTPPTIIAGTITFSDNLKFIGSGAFGGTVNIKDIYPLGTTAPECCVNAFSTETCVANNTLPKINGSVVRDSYMVGTSYAAVLHIPTSADDVNAKRYTDVTKEFSIAIGEYDDKGRLVMYPMQTEFNKAYTDATTGYLWNAQNYQRILNEGWATFYEIIDPVYYATGSSLDTYQGKTNDLYNGNANAVFYETGLANAEYNKTIYDKDYRGWHQIVLSNYANPGTTPERSHDFSGINDNEWWTICVPFDMTKGELLKVFGTSSEQLGDDKPSAYPKVSEFMGVDRKYGKTITLKFGPDLVANASTEESVVIRAGHPYMIQPALPDNPSPASRVLTYTEGDGAYYDKMLDKTDAEQQTLLKNNVVVRTKVGGEVTTDNASEDVHCPNNYAFVGSFWMYSMPQYSYFLGWNKDLNNGNGGVAYYYQTGPENPATRSWNPRTAIILPNWNASTGFNTASTFETIHWVFNATSEYFTDDSFETTPATPAGAKIFGHGVMDFDITVDGELETGVNSIHNGDYVATSVSGNVYDLSGRLVRSADSKAKLSKGIYVVNGKKVIINK